MALLHTWKFYGKTSISFNFSQNQKSAWLPACSHLWGQTAFEPGARVPSGCCYSAALLRRWHIRLGCSRWLQVPGFELRSSWSTRNPSCSGTHQACPGLCPMWHKENSWSVLAFLVWSQENFLQNCRNSSFWVRLYYGLFVSRHWILCLWWIFSVEQTAQTDEKDCWRTVLWT